MLAHVVSSPRRVEQGVVPLGRAGGDRCHPNGLIDEPTSRTAAPIVSAVDEGFACPADTVLLPDEDPASGAGGIAEGFDADTFVWSFVDYSSARVVKVAERFTVIETRGAVTAELLRSLALADRRRRTACADASRGPVALDLADADGG